ncbi:uncharacterized protein LOC112600845 isoform X2 [Melanaphis sacchari]|uniref:uncharacterized protein LOC112600845 isoform X2 n=1 Tax=Melanaphis sacchari TaxID=742174 RepID=UPI000DC15560|nr:uncharacterized protein LOC112600845 isoform X2 [Melanaphis sacchari]
MIVLFWYLVRLLLTAFRKPKSSGGSHALTFGTSTHVGDSLTTLTMKSSNHSDAGSKDYRGGSSSTVGQEDLIPIFLRRLNDLNIRVGTRTRFLIELEDATGVQVRWYHNNEEANSERYQYIHEGGFYCLDIVPVTLFDEGLWVCTAQNYAGKSSTAAHLSLTVPKAFKKPIFVEQLKAVLTQRGIVSLECKVIGVPTPKLRWYKDDKEIKAGDIFALTANSEEDCLGIYTCEATNVMGTALSTSKIQVTHTPLDGNRDADSLIPYGPPPKFIQFLKDASGKVGSVLFLECQVEVPPWPRSIGWYNNNGIVNESPLYHLMADGLGMYGIEIKSLRADHSTTWKCVATSSTGAKAVTSCVVSVSYPKNYRVPRFLESLRAIMTDEGLVSFECKVIGYPTPQLSWFKDGKQLQPGDVYELTGSKSLGSYCCVARNCMGETSSIAELTIEDIQNQLNESEKLQLTSNTQPPRFLLGLKSVEANINESFVFTIKVATESAPSISWYKEDEQLTESNRYQFSTEDNGTYILSILSLEIDDQAEWKCVAINKYGQTVTSSFLKLNIPKTFKSPRFLEELRIAFSNEGSVNLECKVIGVPQPQLKWFKDGQELNPGDMHKIISGQSGTCCLGTYTCQAHNCMGTVSSSATLLTMEDKSTVKSCASEEYLSVGNPLVRNESLSTIPEERTSQMEKSYTIEEPADISFSFDGKEVTVSLYETPDLTHDEALQIIEMYADELSEHISEDNVVDLPSLRIVKESSISGPVMMEALVIDVPIDFCRQQIVSDTEFDGVSLTEDITLANNDKSDSMCENSLEYFSDHLSSGNSKREVFYSASDTTPKNSSMILKQQSEDDEHQSFQTPKLFMSDSDDQILTQLKLDEKISPYNSRQVIGPLARSESNNTEEEVSETLAEIENEPLLSHNYCASEIVTQSDEDGLYLTVLNKIRGKGIEDVVLSSEEDDVLKIISRPNVDEFLKYMKIILEGSIVKMRTYENFNITSTTTELERSIQALHSLAWKFIEETERNDVTELDKNTAENVSSLMTAINASLLALEQIDDPFGVSDNVLNEIQSSVCFDLETLNNSDLSASAILDRLSDQIKNFTIVVNSQITRVTEQRIIAVLRNTIGTTLTYIKTLQQNCSKIKCVDINSLTPLFSMVQPLEIILNDITVMEEASIEDSKPNYKLKQILIPPISSIAFALDNLNTTLKNDSSNDDQDLKDIYDRINESTNQFMILASQGMDNNKIAECFISFTKPINDLCCHLRRLGRSTENIVSSDYGSDDKLLLDFETLFDELMMDIDTLINNVNFVQDSENNMNPLGSLLEPLQDMKIGLFQVNQVLLSNQTGSTMSYEVISCFEHLSQQLVQLNNCIVNQSIVEETDKEIPFESSIKMMQNILFDDAIDDLGVNGILFGSVMKPLLQLQNLIVSKMASVESDLSFSEHTDVTGGACDTQSLSLSLSNNAQTVLNKATDENSKNVITESSILYSSDKDSDKQNNIHIDNSEINKDSTRFENNVNNDLVIKRGFEFDIGDTFKDEEPNIITSEDERDNSGFEALFDETDLETISDFVEDGSKLDHKLSDLYTMSEKDIETMHKVIDDSIPEHLLESLEKNNQQDLVLNSSVDLFDELQETLKNMSEVAQDKLTEIYDLDSTTSNINDLQKNNSKYIDQHCDKTNKLLDDSLDVAKINNSTIKNTDKLTQQNIIEMSEVKNEKMNQRDEIILETDQNDTFKTKDMIISGQDDCIEEKVFELEQGVDLIENFEFLDSDKSISNNTIITVNEISDSSEVKMKEIDNTHNLETAVNLLTSTTEKYSQIVNVPDENVLLITSENNLISKINDNDEDLTTLSNLKNEILDSVLLKKSNIIESNKNIKTVSNDDTAVDTNNLNESEKLNTLSNDNDTENREILSLKNIEEPLITENVSQSLFQQDNTVVNESDSIHSSEICMAIQEAQTGVENELNSEKDNLLISIDKSTNSIELKKVLVTLVDEKNGITSETNSVIGNQNNLITEEILKEIKPYDNRDLINKSDYTVEERKTHLQELTSSIDCENSIAVLEDNIIRDMTKKQNSGNENLNFVKNEYNNSGTVEINQDINIDNILHHDLQPNINTISTTDNNQIVIYSTECENTVNPITELNIHQTEEYDQNLSDKCIDEVQNHENKIESVNEEPIENIQQKCFTAQQNNILQISNSEVKAIDELNEQCEILSEMKVNDEIEHINSKIVVPSGIIQSENVNEQPVLDNSNRIDDLDKTQYNVDKCVDNMLPVTENMTETAGSNVLDKQSEITITNSEEDENKPENPKQNKKLSENNEIIDSIAMQFKNDVTNDFDNSLHLTLNEKESSSDQKINKLSENEITEIAINDEEKSINTLNKPLEDLKQSDILDNNDADLLKSTLNNNKTITLDNSQSINPYEFEENHVQIQFKENIDSKNEDNKVLNDKDSIISNLEHLESKNEVLNFPDETINNEEEKSCCEIQYIQNDGSKLINESPNSMVEQTTDLICNEMILVSNTQQLDSVVIDLENIKEQHEIELNISEPENIAVLENTIDTVEKNNWQNDDMEQVSKDKLISNLLDMNNLIDDGNKEKSITKEYIEIQTSKLIDEKSISASNKDDVNNREGQILNKSQLSVESEIEVSLTENDCVTTISDLETTKINTDEKINSCETLASENDLTEHKSSILVNENTEDCKEIASHLSMCIGIFNENNVSQHKEFTECQPKVISENFDTSETVSLDETEITNIISNEEKSNRNENNLEIKKTSEQNNVKNDTNKNVSPILNDVCKYNMENEEILVNDKNHTLSLCEINFENVNEKLSKDLENNKEITENNFVKPFDIKSNLEDTDNIKNDEINTEEINKEFIHLEDLDMSTNILETIIDPSVDTNKSKKQKENSTIEKLSNLVDELNTSLETPKSECLSMNKDIDGKIIDRSNVDFSINESSEIEVDEDIIAQHNNTSKIEIQDKSVDSVEKVNVVTKDYPDKNHGIKSDSILIEIQGNEVSSTINYNIENEHSTVKLESINADENKLINEVKINNQIDIITAIENNVNVLNDTIFEDGINDLSAEESLGTFSIVPKLHCIEKIAANQTECVTLENTNIFKSSELNGTENIDQRAQVKHELNIAAIGNVIIDYDSIKEHSVNVDDEQKCTENATIAVILDDNAFKVVSTNVDVLNAPTKDTIIAKELIEADEVSEDFIRATTLLCENRNSDISTADILNDQTENSDNFVKENVQSKIELINKPTEIFNVDTYKQGDLALKQEQNEEIIDESQQSLQKSDQIFESLVLSIDGNDTMEEVKIDVSNENIKITKDENITDTKDKVDVIQELSTKSKESPSSYSPTNNINIKENKIDTTEIINETLDEKNKMLLDEIKNSEKIITDFKSEKILEKAVETDDQNKNNNEIDKNEEKLNGSEIEIDKAKRRSIKKKSSLPSDDKKSPSPDKTKNNISISEKEIDTTKSIDMSIEEKNKKMPNMTNDTEKLETKLESEVLVESNENEKEEFENEISTKDTKQKNEKLVSDKKELSEKNIEIDEKIQGSKENKISLQSENNKSSSTDTMQNDISSSVNKIDSNIINDTYEDKSKNLSNDNTNIEKEEIKLDKSEPEIALDNTKSIEKITKNNVLTEDQNKNQKNNEIGKDDNMKSTKNNEEKDKIKRGSKKNKSTRPRSENKKSPSPEITKNILSINNKTVEASKTNDNSIEEKNKTPSDHYNNTENLEIESDKFEPKICSKNIEKDVSTNDKDKNQKNNRIDADDNKLLRNEKNKITEENKKKKLSPEPEIKKLSSSDITKNNISVIENNIDTNNIDKTTEDNNKQISEDNKHIEKVKTKVQSKTVAENDINTTKKIEKDVLNNTQIEIQNNDDIGSDDKIRSTENYVEKDKAKQGSKKDKLSPRPKGKKSTSPDKTKEITEHLKIQSRDENDTMKELEQQESKIDESKYLGESKQTLKRKEVEPLAFPKSSINNYGSADSCQSEINLKDISRVGIDKKQTNETRSFVGVLTDEEGQRVAKNCFTTNKKELKSTGFTKLDDVGVLEVPSSGKRPVNRHLLDVTDAHKIRPNTLTYRSLTPDPLTSYRSLTPDHLTSYRSLTPDSPTYRSCITPRSRYATSTRYAGSSDRELYGGSSSSRSSRSSSRSMSPYLPESRISARNLWPTGVAAYRCLSETSVPLSSRLLEEERTSGWPHTNYGVTTRRRRGSDSFLHDSGVRDGSYYSSFRLSNSRSTTYGATEDLYLTKEAFKGLYFCVRMIDQTVSSGARVKFWCSVIGHPEPHVQWYRDGQKLNSFTYNSSARYETKYDGGLAQLIINNAQSGDSGEYTCVAINSRDRISTTGFLTVYTSPSVFNKPLLQPSLSVDSIESSRGVYSRTNHNFRLPANSKFDFGSRNFGSDLVSRRPEYPKFISSIIADDVATCGGTIALQVRVQGSPVPNVTWMRESRPLPRLSGKYVYLDEGGLYTLLVMDSTVRDGGTYVCRACNLYGVADVEKAVRVVSPQDYTDRRGVKPAIIVSRPDDRLNVAIGEDITVTLRVAGEPKPKVIWMRGSRDVTFFDRSSKETVNDYVRLSIKKAQPSDAGTYFIIAKNVYGSDRAFVTVGVRKRARSLTPPQIRNTISSRWLWPIGGRGGKRCCANNEVPGPVRSEPTVTDRTNNRISLQWDRPEKPETVLVYRVETRTADEECWREVGMTPTNTIDVYNLKPGYQYQFRVAARNRFGWSQPVTSKGYVDVFEPKFLPEFHQPLPGQTRVLLQHKATLQCHVRGIPEPRVTWFKDGEPLLATDRHSVARTDAGKCTLSIEDVADGDAGRYSCEAVNDQGRVCTLTVVQVIANRRIVEAEQRLQGCLMKNNNFKESAPLFTKHLIDRRVEINSTVRLSCQVNGLPVPLVLWYKDGRPIDFLDRTEGDRKPPIRDDSDDFYTLELTEVKYHDSGTYAAVASNAIGKASTRCVLEVFNKNRTDPAVPTFVFGLPTTMEAVDSIVLSAQIDAYRPVKAEWFRDGIQLRNGRRVDIITDHDGNLELRIACVTTRDSGTYMLRVSNGTGTIESRCDVNVVERKHNDTRMEQISLINHLYSKKPKFVVKPKFQEVEEGQEVIIDSEIVGDPLPRITWLRDGLKPEYYRDNSEFLCISNGNRYQLKIPHAKLTHTGTYTLLAANPHGQIKALISLQVYSTGHCKKKMVNGTNYATVERLPRISRGLVDIECRENDSVTFECKLNITQETDIRWQKDGKLVRLSKQIKSQLIDGDTARLEISTVSPLHEGLYTCTAFNELGQDSTSARLILLSNSQETTKIPQSNGQQKTMIGSPILAGESNDRGTKRLKRSSAPKFYAVLHDRIADVGETVRFQCSVSGHPPPWSSWEKDGQPIGVNSRIRIREDDDYRSMEICDVTTDDAGLYRITVENKFGKIQATARLEVLTHNQTTNDVQITSSSNGRRQSGSAACAGENFTLSCEIRGNPMSDVTWYKNNVEVKPDDRVTSSLDDLAARLSICNLESADTGVYTCVARCESGVTRCSTELCVFDTKLGTDSCLKPPIFVQGLVPKRTVDEGEPVQLTVKLQGAVPMNATWFKNDVPVPDCADFEYLMTEDRGEFGLSITDPFVKDSGIYSCKVANTFGQAVSSGQLVINEMSCENQMPMVIELNNNMQDIEEKTASDFPVNTKTALPASILSGPSDTTVFRGDKVVLKTAYRGNPEPRVQWLRAGKVLESDAHLCITNENGESSLTIDSITADDCGKYVVRVDNGHGNDFHFASVAVEGPPDPPAGRPVVSVSETSADVTWSSPAYDGGCMVTGYGVEVRPFNQSDWKLVADKCHSLSHIVRGLAPGESYVFRVRAENMHGSSEASLESTPVYILQTDYGNTLWPKTVNIENGDLFDKQYEMLDELGKGRYGVVYKVKERETNKYYAAKFVRCIKSTDKEKAQEEVDIMNCLRHPKLLQLDAAFDKPREVVLVTEYISGGELFERVVADDFTLTEKDCILFTKQICEGVDYMHKQNVVHLDLKPENIMCQSRTSHYIKLIDFGLAQKIIPGQPMRVLFGTPEFIPPEIIGYEPIGFESDMWSVGVICYVLLSGLSPFMGDNDSETFTNITKAEFDFDDEAFDAVSQDAKDFISALLIKRKELRLTAKECLKHKWLAQQDMDMSCVILSTDKLKKFIIRRKWQKTGNAIRALGRMATLSAASRRGVVGGSSAGTGGGGMTDGNGARCILQKLKMASLKEEESTSEPPSEGQETTITETIKSGSGHRVCDDRSDSGFSECLSVSSPISMLVRPPDCPSAISEETPTVSNRDCSPPPPIRSSPPLITGRPSSPVTRRTYSPATRYPSSPTTCRSSSSTTNGSSSPATRGPSSLKTHPRSPLPRNRHDTIHPVHDVPLSTGTGVSGQCKTNRMIFDGGRRDGSASSAGKSGTGGVQRKETIRVQTADNFKKAVAFWKQ